MLSYGSTCPRCEEPSIVIGKHRGDPTYLRERLCYQCSLLFAEYKLYNLYQMTLTPVGKDYMDNDLSIKVFDEWCSSSMSDCKWIGG